MKNVKFAAIVAIFLMVLSMAALNSNAATPAAPANNALSITGVAWYSPNSTVLATPGTDYVPLFVSFTNAFGTVTDLNVSMNLSAYPNSPFSYSYVAGPNKEINDHYNVTLLPSGSGLAIMQMVNISSSASKGLYQEKLSYNFISNVTGTPLKYYGNTSFDVPLLGYSKISIVNYYTNPPILYQNQKFISLTVATVNTGTSFAQNLVASASSTDFNVITNPYNVQYYPSGEMLNFTFLLNAKNVTGSAPVVFTLGPTSFVIPLYLHNYGTISVTSSIPKLYPGSSQSLLSFNITNTANVTLRDIQIHLLSPSVISIHVSSSNPLGALTANNETFSELKPGQTITATFIVDTHSTAKNGNYPAQLLVMWRLNDTASSFYTTYNFNETVSLTTLQNIQGSLTFTPFNIVILVVIVALIIALIAVSARSRRLSKEKAKREKGQNNVPSLPHKDITPKKDEVSSMIEGAKEKKNNNQ